MPTIGERAEIAANPNTPNAVLREMAADKSPKVRAAVAANPSTDIGVLDVLGNDTHFDVRFAVARNPSAQARQSAIKSSNVDTRSGAAQRSDLTAADRAVLMNDPDHHVREQLAAASTDAATLISLTGDPHPMVRATVVLNPNLPTTYVEAMAADPAAPVRAAVAGSRRVRPGTLTQLAEDRSADVRWEVMVTNHERQDIVEKLTADPDEINAMQARAQRDWLEIDPPTLSKRC